MSAQPRTVLLVEDNPGDVQLVEIALSEVAPDIRLEVAKDGDHALALLRHSDAYESSKRPDLVLLDLNTPKADGREVLRAIKSEEKLRGIPVVILTSSDAERDIRMAYDLHANAFVKKPECLDDFMRVFKTINQFWFNTAKLPDQ